MKTANGGAPRPPARGFGRIVKEARIRAARSTADIGIARSLFVEYSRTLGVDLCFQNFEAELKALPGDYAAPGGVLFLAFLGKDAVGCIAVRPLKSGECEMKRLFLQEKARGLGLGRDLVDRAIFWSRRKGYTRMLLDTLPSMRAAQAMYETIGFKDTTPYRHNPVPGSRFMALDLRVAGPSPAGRTAAVGYHPRRGSTPLEVPPPSSRNRHG